MKPKAYKSRQTVVGSIVISLLLLLLLLLPHIEFFHWDTPSSLITTEIRAGGNFNDLPKVCTTLLESSNDLSTTVRSEFETPLIIMNGIGALLLEPLYLLAFLGCSLYPIALLTKRKEAGRLGRIGFGTAALASLLETVLNLLLCYHCRHFGIQTYPSVTVLSLVICPVAIAGWLWVKNRQDAEDKSCNNLFFRRRLLFPSLVTAGAHICVFCFTTICWFILPNDTLAPLLNVSFYLLIALSEILTIGFLAVAIASLCHCKPLSHDMTTSPCASISQ